MKKKLSIIMVLLLTASMVSLALADEAGDTEDEEVIKEIGIMSYSYGSEVRLLQLEKVLTRNIMIGEKINETLHDLGIETTELDPILFLMNILLGEIQDAYNNLENTQEAVEHFVDLKNESINLTREFRITLHDMLDEETMELLRKEMKDFYKGKMQNLREQIRNMIRSFNRNQLNFILEILGLVDEELLEDYTNGEVTLDEITKQLGEYISGLTKEERKNIFADLRIGNIQRNINANAAYENAMEYAHQRREERWNNRLAGLNDIDNPGFRDWINDKIRGPKGGF
jgi:hypothetical protein